MKYYTFRIGNETYTLAYDTATRQTTNMANGKSTRLMVPIADYLQIVHAKDITVSDTF